jgi:hypothetical protein
VVSGPFERLFRGYQNKVPNFQLRGWWPCGLGPIGVELPEFDYISFLKIVPQLVVEFLLSHLSLSHFRFREGRSPN